MIIRRFVCLIPVLLIFCYHGCNAFDLQTNYIGNADYNELECPNAEDIAPCICTIGTDYFGNATMDMNCTHIADEQQLYHVFNTGLSSKAFNRLDLGATHLTYLSDDVFGNATFWSVYAEDGSLTYISPNTFKKSVSTLGRLILSNNQLTYFPFETIKEYSLFEALYLDRNPIKNFPASIQSATMVEFIMYDTLLHEIPAASMELPELKDLVLTDLSIDCIGKEAFIGLSDIRQIYLTGGTLRHLESLQFAITSPNLDLIILQNNFIESVEPDTFKGIQSGTIVLQGNKLTVLPEATWRPVLDAGVTLVVGENDLTCGCDIAWLVLEPAYHPQVVSAKCHNGDMLIDLDSFFFENNC